MKIEDKAVNADCCHKSPYIRTHQNLSKMHSVSGFSPRNLLMHMWHTFLNCINGLAYAGEFRSTYLYTTRVWPWKKISFAWVSKWPKCHNLVSCRTKRTCYLFSFGQTWVHNCWSSTNNTSLMSEEIKIGTTLMISENTNNASSKKFILVNQNKPLPIFE